MPPPPQNVARKTAQRCCSLQAGCRWIGSIQIIFSLIAIAISIYGLVRSKQQWDKYEIETSIKPYVIVMVAAVFLWILRVLLVIRANHKSVRICQVWFYIMIVVTIVYVTATVYAAIVSRLPIVPIVVIVIYIFFMGVVYAFIQEIKTGSRSNYRRI